MTVRISMWSGPRNVSTALMYSFRQRPDTRVVDEPLYGHYLRVTGSPHPGDAAVLAAMETDGERVVTECLLGRHDRPVLFVKNMAHHLVDLDRGFLAHLTNALLIRDPREMLPSLARRLPDPTLRDTGLDRQVELLEHELARGHQPVVLDARELLLDPASVLRRACHRLGLPFTERMLSWPPGPKPEDGVWAPHWYDSVHASTGFAPHTPEREPFPQRLTPLLEICTPLYERLAGYAITAI